MDYSYGYDPSLAAGADAASFLSGMVLIIYLISIIGSLVSLIAMWKIFTKAGKPGWAAIVPIYNVVVLFEIVGLEWWHVLVALFVPFAALIYIIIVDIKLAKVFGKGTGLILLLIFIPVVGQLMLAFGNASYNGQVDYVVNNMGMNMNNQNNMNGMNVNSVNNNINNGRDYSAMNVNNDDHYYNAELDHMSQKQINEMVKNNMQMKQNNNQMNNNQFTNQNNTLNNNQFNTQGVPMNNMMNNQVNEQSIIQEEQRLDNQTGVKVCPVCGSNQVATARECSMCGHKFM